MDVNLYHLPACGDPRAEETYCKFLTLYRNGETLDAEILDWMDYIAPFLDE